jgi:hypothetical protein
MTDSEQILKYKSETGKKKSRWGQDFSHTSRPTLGSTQSPVQWVPGLTWGLRRPGRGADHPLPSSAEVENEYSYTSTTPLGRGCPVIG